jgi:hypothetical protein
MPNRKRFSSAILWGLISVTLLSFYIQSFAQSQEQPLDSKTKTEDKASSCFVYVAMVNVEVTDRQGKEVTDLRKDDFIIYENGVKQEMCYWKRNVGSDRATDQSMYEVGYYPTNFRFKDEWRKIRVLLRSKDQRKLKVQFTPKGYYAKKELRK